MREDYIFESIKSWMEDMVYYHMNSVSSVDDGTVATLTGTTPTTTTTTLTTLLHYTSSRST